MNTHKSSIALGAFDGLHLGHQAVLAAAFLPGFTPAVLTFRQSPSGEPLLLPDEDRRALLTRRGFSKIYTLDFEEVKDTPAEVFAEQFLLGDCRAERLVCGEDFRFGKGAKGDAEMLAALCNEQGAQLLVIPPVEENGEKISSSRIRKLIEAGDIAAANRLLGRPFGFAGEVIHGNHLGTGLGTPTINQAYPEGLTVPRFGVYAAWCRADGEDWFGVTNIGVKPTVGSDKILAETWMPDFSGDLYGKRVRLFLLDFIRPERRFDSLEELKAVILQNAEQAREIAAENTLSVWNAEEILP